MELRDVDTGNKITERFRTDEALESMFFFSFFFTEKSTLLAKLNIAIPGFTFPTENDFPDVPGNGKLPVFRFFPDFLIGKRFEIQISVFDIFRPDFGVFRPENIVGDRKL